MIDQNRPSPTPRINNPKRKKIRSGQSRFDFLYELAPQKLWMAVAILMFGLILTVLASLYVKSEVESAAEKEFDFICDQIQRNIADRIDSSALALYSGAALFYASEEVSRSEWQVFTSKQRIDQQMPGTQGVGFAIAILPDQLDQHIQEIRNGGFPDYTIRPEGKREMYSSIIYLEPFSGRNLRAFGYDMFSEPMRRAAMERARDENSAALSGKVTLVQETTEDIQAGTLMYVPVYRHNLPVETVEERRAALLGWVYSPFRMNDLMHGTLVDYEIKQEDRHITFQIFDGDVISAETLLYDSRSDEDKANAVSSTGVLKVTQVNFFGQLWTLKFTQAGGLASFADYDSFWLVLFGGASISLLVFGLNLSMLSTAHYLESTKLLAEMDSLTGVFNRRKILDLAENEYTRANRQHHSLTFLMIDLNFFKHINDNFGHAVGDQALRLTASAIQDTLRKGIDKIGRFGGDEFVVILPETSIAQVDAISLRLRTNVANNTQDIAQGMQPISLSIGAAELKETTRSLQEMIDRADHAMYADKKQTRKNA